MCSKIHTCAFHRQGRNNRSQMDLFNRKVLPNLQRSLWTSRTSSHSLRRYIVTTLAIGCLIKSEVVKNSSNELLSACLSWSFASWFSVLPFVWFRLCSSFVRSLVHPTDPSMFRPFVCSFCLFILFSCGPIGESMLMSFTKRRKSSDDQDKIYRG